MLEKIALKTIYKYNLINENDKIIVGVSGGADSISLLHFLNSIKKKFNLQIFCVHIEHGIRGEESIKDAEFVKSFCQNLNIPIDIFNYDIALESKKLNMTIEEAGRHFRYKSFEKSLKKYKANKIAVAHNKNDNIETFFMRLFRGAGIKGLASIPFKRDYIIRPLLNCERDIIEEYCKKNNLLFRHDLSNFEDIYTRNKIRLNLIPSLKNDFNQNLIDTISNTIHSLSEENSFLENMANSLFAKCLEDKNENSISLNMQLLKNYDMIMQKRIIRLALFNFTSNLYNVSFQHIDNILNLLSKQSGKMLNLPNNIKVKTIHNTLYFFLEENNSPFCYNLQEDCIVFIKELNKYALLTKNLDNNLFFINKVCTIPLNYDKIKNSITLRSRKSGDVILLNGMHKKIKKLFIDLKIPSYKRNLIPILADKDNIIAIPNFFVSDNYKQLNSKENTIYLYLWKEH